MAPLYQAFKDSEFETRILLIRYASKRIVDFIVSQAN